VSLTNLRHSPGSLVGRHLAFKARQGEQAWAFFVRAGVSEDDTALPDILIFPKSRPLRVGTGSYYGEVE
jgi:hypothetical protein